MWNGNNGNNGYNSNQGYGPQDVYGTLNSQRSQGAARYPFIEGSCRLVLVTLEEFNTFRDGVGIRALLEVLESKDGRHKPGELLMKVWKIQQPPKFQGGMSDGELFTDFCRKLKGAPDGTVMSDDIRTLMKIRAAEQLARGTVIDVNVVHRVSKTTGKSFPNTYWATVPQQPQDIAMQRQRLEAKGIPNLGGNTGGQFQGAPHPAQMQQGYAQQPQGYGPGPSGQGGWGGNPGQAFQQAGFQPQGAPFVPQGMQGTPPQQQQYQQTAAAPQAQQPWGPQLPGVPTGNGGNQGGNQGGGW